MRVSRRRRVYEILEAGGPGDPVDRIVDVGLFALIVLNIIAIMFETVEPFGTRYSTQLRAFETFSVIVFTVEYAARIWACTADQRYTRPVRGRLRYARSPMLLVDLWAILPFYLPFVLGIDLRFLRVLRLFRLARILKIARYSEGFRTLSTVFRSKAPELAAGFFVVVVLLVLSSTLMFYIEGAIQPEAFSSIPATMWWAVVTLTTVGYGDTYPITTVGRVLGGVIALLGVTMVALPAGILGSGFVEEYQRRRGQTRGAPGAVVEGDVCPHCGHRLGHAAHPSESSPAHVPK